MAAQIEETRNVPMDVLKTYSKASLHALLLSCPTMVRPQVAADQASERPCAAAGLSLSH